MINLTKVDLSKNDPKETGYVPQEIDFEEEDKVKKKNKKEVRYRTVPIKRKPSL